RRGGRNNIFLRNGGRKLALVPAPVVDSVTDCRYSIARRGANMLCKLQRIISVCGIASLALPAGRAGAQVRFIDAVPAQAADALAADDLQARKDKIRHDLANGTLTSGKGTKHRQPGDPTLLALPHWSDSFRSEGVDYPFTVIGGDPAARQTTVVPTV